MVMTEGVRILPILRDILSEHPENRSLGADAATDLIQEYSDAETLCLTFTLACCCEVERDPDAQEAQLHALAEFAEHYLLPQFVLLRTLGINATRLTGSAREHFDYLVEMASVE